RYGKPIHWFIMTSHANHEATEAFFKENDFFGLSSARVHFFRQGRMPAVDFNGRILLETRGSIAISPDGHGGSLRALARSGALDLIAKERIDSFHLVQEDNSLIRMIHLMFYGFHLRKDYAMSSKMITKPDAGDNVGNCCVLNERSV